MTYFIVKAVISGVLIAIISELARRYPDFGGFIASLPIISILAILWLWHGSDGDNLKIASFTSATLWYILPGLPFFIVLPILLRRGMDFWYALAISIALTIALYLSALWVVARFKIKFS